MIYLELIIIIIVVFVSEEIDQLSWCRQYQFRSFGRTHLSSAQLSPEILSCIRASY